MVQLLRMSSARMSNVVLESASLERPRRRQHHRLPRRLTAGEDTLPVHVANTNSTATTCTDTNSRMVLLTVPQAPVIGPRGQWPATNQKPPPGRWELRGILSANGLTGHSFLGRLLGFTSRRVWQLITAPG